MVSRPLGNVFEIDDDIMERFADLDEEKENELIYNLVALIFAERDDSKPNS